jgi:hypothetical protein
MLAGWRGFAESKDAWGAIVLTGIDEPCAVDLGEVGELVGNGAPCRHPADFRFDDETA